MAIEAIEAIEDMSTLSDQSFVKNHMISTRGGPDRATISSGISPIGRP
jgi:hypothetical protein